MRIFGLVAASLFLLTACGGVTEEPGQQAPDAPVAPVEVELVESGFGQQDEIVQGIAVVTTGDERAVGEFVTVSMNFLDASGAIVGTSEQVEDFSWVAQDLVVPVWLDLSATPGVEVAEVDTSVSLSDYGMGGEEVEPLDQVSAREIRADQYGGTVAVFEMANPTDSDFTSARIGVVCLDESGAIIGGGSEFPNLMPAGKSIVVEAMVLVSAEPATCAAYPNYGL